MLYYQGKYYNLKHMENNQSHPTKMLLHNQCRLLKYMPKPSSRSKRHKHVQYYHNKKYHCIIHKQFPMKLIRSCSKLNMQCYQYKYYNQQHARRTIITIQPKCCLTTSACCSRSTCLTSSRAVYASVCIIDRNVKHQCISHKQFQLINKELCKLNMLCQSVQVSQFATQGEQLVAIKPILRCCATTACIQLLNGSTWLETSNCSPCN